MSEWVTLSEAWAQFYRGIVVRQEPTHAEFEMVREISEDVGETWFRPRPSDNEIIQSQGDRVRINPGFVSTRTQVRHVLPDSTYASLGFPYRHKFEHFLAPPPQDAEVTHVRCPDSGISVPSGRECDFCGELHEVND